MKSETFKLLCFFGWLYLPFATFGQTEPSNGTIDSKASRIALKNATIYVSPEKKIQNAVLLLKDGKIEKVGTLQLIPSDALVIDCQDKVIVPAFIELNSDFGIPKAQAKNPNGQSPQLSTAKEGPYYWNESIHPEVNAIDLFNYDDKAASAFADKGFGFVLSRQNDGIFQGSGVLISLGNKEQIFSISAVASSFYSFSKGASRQTYPSSQMGAIALMRQVLYDAQAYKLKHDQRNMSLESINMQLKSPMFFDSKEKYEILRAEKIAKEHGIKFHYLGSGNEYEAINELKQIETSIVCPINFPDAYDVTDPYVARQIPLSDLKHWENAPLNPSILSKADINICITGKGTKDAKVFWMNLRRAIKAGLAQKEALAALTTNPAKIMGVDQFIGSLQEGRLASFMVYNKDPFEEEAKLMESWAVGKRTVLEKSPKHSIGGDYHVLVKNKSYDLNLKDEEGKLSGKLTYRFVNPSTGSAMDSTVKVTVKLNEHDIMLQFRLEDDLFQGNVSLHGKVNSKLGVIEGMGMFPDGSWEKWNAIGNKPDKGKKDKESDRALNDTIATTWFPNMAYGFDSIPAQQNMIITNATLWTNEEAGVIERGTIVIEGGKIIYVGDGNYPTPANAVLIDAEGKHVTSGIIDEHSHIAISRGVNEGGQAISAEVSIGDVVNPDDINVYRQLSGGVTAAQLLHGSANPIGGQSALIKLKWGHSPEEMLIDDAPKFIKFALGENVKQSNWGDNNSIRFPQTRMGVEQLYNDGFDRAKKYEEAWKKYKADTTTTKPAVDLELEVLVEILNNERNISCHSYVQSEINMLMHLAENFGFKINTFTHILEGYKLADKMVEHGAGGSTFSDWWAYKFEVNDAIPYNASLLAEQGVVVAINSDDAEMGRRLNQEAAKAVKYGGMSEVEALKMVTLNPAKLLHLDDRMGSLKVGKDADLVIWTDHPLSIEAKAEKTIIEGKILFDQHRDQEMRKINQQEKARIISKMAEDNKNGGASKSYKKKNHGAYHCDTIGEEMSTGENAH